MKSPSNPTAQTIRRSNWARQPPSSRRLWGTVTDIIISPPSVTVQIGTSAKSIPLVRHGRSYRPILGDKVFIGYMGTDMVVEDALATETTEFDTGPMLAYTGGITLPQWGDLIPQTGSALEIDCYSRCESGTVNAMLLMRFNGDFAGHYDYIYNVNSSAFGSGEGHNTTQFYAGFVAGALAPAGSFAHTRIVIPNYTETHDKTFTSTFNIANGYSAGACFVGNAAGWWWGMNQPITSIGIWPGAGRFVAGTRLTLRVLP